jgi:GNAT superfamily N-acetyltransferase
VPEVHELQVDESHRAALALLELRPRLESAERLTSQIDAQRAMGYRVVASFEDGDDDAAAVAGFRIAHNLAWGRFLYVDDLVTRAALRGRGHADAVMAWVEREARRQGCGELHLDSGVGADRADAHRFYFRHRMRIASYHFSRTLAVDL